MAELKVVMSTADGKSYQVVLKDAFAEALHGFHLEQTVRGESLGYPGYEFLITGGSDKCGFPMRKGIQLARKMVVVHGGVGFRGKARNKKKQGGLVRKKTVCGERITHIIHQVNLKVLKEGPQKLAPAEAKAETKA